MAPNKKKKKLASNPARGFATVSTASKTKDQGVDEIKHKNDWGSPGEDAKLLLDDRIVLIDSVPASNSEKVLETLSPEELEMQLENSSLQNLVDIHGEKIKKDASRQASRLQTERRLLRSQAEYLSTRHWLPVEIMQLISNLLYAQTSISSREKHGSGTNFSASKLSQDDVVARLWKLERLLPQLGFSDRRTRLALQHLLIIKHGDLYEPFVGKDSVWGLDECLDWLALTSEPGELPSFAPRAANNPNSRPPEDRSLYGAITETDMTPSASTDSMPSAPFSRATPSQSPIDEGSAVHSDSGSESDLEPDQLVNKYLALQLRLYEINPDLVNPNGRKQKQILSKVRDKNASQHSDTDQRITRLTAKLDQIKFDILFDEEQANTRWAQSWTQLAEETSERKRFGIRDGNDQELVGSEDASTKIVNSAETTNNDQDTSDMLGNLFSGLPDSTTDPTTSESSMKSMDSSGSTVVIRYFGKWAGIGPRRVLEDACRARDSFSRISYKLISASTFSNRHSLLIKWSRNQQPIPDLPVPLDFIKYEAHSHSVRIEMVSIACPDTAQSEAYISTVALFLVFGSVPKEEKVYLRLPSIWRELWTELLVIKKEQDRAKDRNALRELRRMVEEHSRDTTQAEAQDALFTPGAVVEQCMSEPQPIRTANLPARAPPEVMRSLWMIKASTITYKHMLTYRMKLPIWAFRNELLDIIHEHQVIIVCGETGCGKSTQVPSFILEHELSSGRSCMVYCTEPRRISAISLARRVSEELGERKIDVGTTRSLVGYAIRLESRISAASRLVYATTGVVMRMLERSENLSYITHLVLDEVHERSIESDFLLIVLRKYLLHRPDLKIVLMSATVDAKRFSHYLGQAPILNVPGRIFPVVTNYLEDAIELTHFDANVKYRNAREYDDNDEDIPTNAPAKTSLSAGKFRHYSPNTCDNLLKLDEYRINYNLIVRLLETIATEETYAGYSKAILVFLPGITEIMRLNDMLVAHQLFLQGWYIYALHSTVATEDQERAFLIPPPGIRKIVLATNIAETGITIPDVTCVVDTGKHKEMRFDERRQMSRLVEVFVSRSNAKQRRGRAGRVQKGLCFHLFTKDRHDNTMPEEQTPEMLRLSLQDLVLRVKICNVGGIEQTLSEALDPPSAKNIRRAIDALVDVKALTTTEDLTPLGRQLAKLPLDVFLGKLILLGSIFGCLDAMLTIAAILSSKSPFAASMGAREQADHARLAFRKGDSDLLTVHNAYCAWRRICSTNAMPEYQFCRKNFLSQQTLSNIEDLKAQLTASVADAGFMKLDDSEKAALNRVHSYSRKRNFVEIPARYNGNNNNSLILNTVIACSFYPKLLKREGKVWRNIANNQSISLHPTSVNSCKGALISPKWLSFYHIMQSSNKLYNAHETSPVEDAAVALMCGEAEFKMFSGVIVIDGNRIRFSVDDWKTMLAIKTLRIQIKQIMAQSFRYPERNLSTQQQAWLDIWQKVFDSTSNENS